MRIDSPPTAAGEALRLRVQNAAASVTLVLFACGAYALAPIHQPLLRRLYGAPEWAFSGLQFLVAAGLGYGVAVVLWMFADRAPKPSKSLRFFGVLGRLLRSPRELLAQGLDPVDRVAVLASLLKGFFGPLMALSLMSFCVGAWSNLQGILVASQAGASWRTLFDRYGFWLAFQVILFVDVAVFTVGYLVETTRLRNEIRSVDPTWLGWAAAMACYPPFNAVTLWILGSQVDEFPQFADPLVHVWANVALLVLMATYASASVAMGWKASNLTHRGIVERGPYAIVRHPAYVCKNMAWWIGSLPLVSVAFHQGWLQGLSAVASVAGWTLLYVLRALTEEDHLKRVDGEYAEYAKRVKWRFIPGVV